MIADSEIKFIYFDIGGVVVLDFSKTDKWEQLVKNLKIPEVKKDKFNKLFETYETSACIGQNINLFIPEAEKTLGIKFPPDYSILEDIVDRFEPNKSIYKLLNKLNKKYKLGLLTNLYPGMLDIIKQKGLLPDIKWDVVIDSSVVGFRKPQDEIYKIAEEKAHATGAQIFYVENSQMHIDGAKKREWQTFLYDPGNTSESNKELKNMLNIQ